MQPCHPWPEMNVADLKPGIIIRGPVLPEPIEILHFLWEWWYQRAVVAAKAAIGNALAILKICWVVFSWSKTLGARI